MYIHSFARRVLALVLTAAIAAHEMRVCGIPDEPLTDVGTVFLLEC